MAKIRDFKFKVGDRVTGKSFRGRGPGGTPHSIMGRTLIVMDRYVPFSDTCSYLVAFEDDPNQTKTVPEQFLKFCK